MYDDNKDYGWGHHFIKPYMSYGPFVVATFFMSGFICVAVFFGLACAVGYLADIAEEFPTRTKKLLYLMTFAVLMIHSLILVMDQLSFWRSLVSIGTNMAYLRILSKFPRVSLMQPFTLLTIVGLMVESTAWYTFFSFRPEIYVTVGLRMFLSFLVLLWMVPFSFVVTFQLEPLELPSTVSGVSSRCPVISSAE